MRSLRFIANKLRITEFPLSCFNQFSAQQEHGGGRGRIRTSVARKERQIYSLLVLATHPPVLEKKRRTPTSYSKNLKAQSSDAASENTKRTRVKRHQPVYFEFQDSLRLTPRKCSGGAGGGN